MASHRPYVAIKKKAIPIDACMGPPHQQQQHPHSSRSIATLPPRHASHHVFRKMQKKLADATNIESATRKTRGGGRSSSASSSLAAAAAAAAAAAEAGSAETAARHLREQDQRSVKLRVERNKRQKYVFNARRGTQVAFLETKCREELDLLSRDESDDAEIALFFEVCARRGFGYIY